MQAAPHANTKQRSTKAIWIMTYGSSGPYVNPDMLLELGNIEADECHSTKDSAMKYTYIHLKKSVRQTSIERFMVRANKAHGIVRNEIYGYTSIEGDVRQGKEIRLEDHVGFHMLVTHFVQKNKAFRPWTDGEPILKRGRILREAAGMDVDGLVSVEHKTKPQMIEYIKKLECTLEAEIKAGQTLRRDYNAVSNDKQSLCLENRALTHEHGRLDVENARLKRKIHELEQITRPSRI